MQLNNTMISSTQKHGVQHGIRIPNRIFVGGINGNISDSELKQFFSTYGHVIDCKVVCDGAGVSKGYGFVTYERQEDVESLLRKEGTRVTFKDRKLNIGPAVRKQVNRIPMMKCDSALSISRLPETAAVFVEQRPLTSAVDEPLGPTSSAIHYISDVPYVYQDGKAIFNPAMCGPLGITAVPQILPLTSACPSKLFPSSSPYIPQVTAYCPLPGSFVPFGLRPQMGNGNLPVAGCIDNLSFSASYAASAERYIDGEAPVIVPSVDSNLACQIQPQQKAESYGPSMRRIYGPAAMPSYPHCGGPVIIVPPLFHYNGLAPLQQLQ